MRRLAAVLVNGLLVLLPFALLEVAFRLLLPVASLPPLTEVNEQAPIARFKPNVEYTYSRDWNFSIVTRKRSNNAGFIHAADYAAGGAGRVAAVVGDSLVEAQQVNAGASVGELLDAAVREQGRVYSFGISGAPLSQYLVYAEHASRSFGAAALAVVVAPNDFDESLLKYNTDRRFHYFRDDGTLERLDYRLSGVRRVLRESAVLRFVMYNLEAGLRLDGLLRDLGGRSAAVQSGEVLEQRIADSRRAVDWFLEQLPARTGLAREAIVLVVDPLRPAVYDEHTRAEAERGYYGRMTRYFIEAAAARGYEVIELQRVFLARYQADGTRFEAAPTDSHWSALGHRVVAAEIRASAAFTGLFPKSGTDPVFQAHTGKPAP